MQLAEPMNPSFAVTVSYLQPSFGDLEGAFDYVDDVLYVEDAPVATFRPIARCADVPCQTRQVPFGYLVAHDVRHIEGALAQMAARRVRPALYEELLAFAKANPGEQRRFPIAAVGSTVKVGERSYVPCVRWLAGSRFLEMKPVEDGDGWVEPTRFLVVPS